MKLFIWHDAARVSDNHHDSGGLGVIAASLDAAREFLRTPYERTGERRVSVGLGAYYTEKWVRKEMHVPADCEAFTAEPDETLDLAGEPEPQAWVWPNAGCC